nr:uncharacterized protein LOC127329073 [Lolium perenne]
MGIQQADRRYLAETRSHAGSRTHSPRFLLDSTAAAPRHRSIASELSSSFFSASLRGVSSHRSFAKVVAGSSSTASMAGYPRPPAPPGVSLPAPGTAPAVPGAAHPPVAAAAASAGPYLGPPGFQGWPAGTPMSQTAPTPRLTAPPPRPAAAFRPPVRLPVPQMPYLPQQPYHQYQGNVTRCLGSKI